MAGQKLGTINIKENFGVELVAIERPEMTRNLIGIQQTKYTVIDNFTDDTEIQADDLLILFGRMEVLHKLAEM